MRIQQTAWFGEQHPAEGVACPSCAARVGQPCGVTVPMPGTCVADQMMIRGMHLERLEVVRFEVMQGRAQ